MTSPTARTLKVLREKEKADACIVEKWNQYAKIRIDAFGMFDLLAINNGQIQGIQVTSGANHKARISKILANPLSVKWILAGGEIYVRSWTKKGGKGKRKLWTERIEQLKV